MRMAASAAKPLNVHSSTPSKPASPAPPGEASSSKNTAATATNPGDITSPHELAAFVENLLQRLDSQFEDMSSQVLDRMNQMSSRVDALENAIQDIINGDITTTGPSVPQSPSPTTPGGTNWTAKQL